MTPPDRSRAFAGVVLVGGASSRMGTDKARLPFNGTTLLEHQLATLRAAGAAPLYLCGRPERPYSVAGVTFISDAPEAEGPIAGIVAALANSASPHIAVLAVDLPRIPAIHFSKVCETPGLAADHTWVPRLHGRFEPLAALYARAHLPLLLAAVQRRDFGLQRLLAHLDSLGQLVVDDVPPAKAPLFTNWNHPHDMT